MARIVIETPDGFEDIPGFAGYAVNRSGTVLTFQFRKGNANWIPLTPIINVRGYCVVSLYRPGGSRARQIHRLVLEAFIGPCPPGMEACHNNGVRTDNRVENLRWDTRVNNHADKLEHGTSQRGSRHPNAKLTDENIRSIRRCHAGGVSIASIAHGYGVSGATISDVLQGRSWTHVY